MEKCPCGLDQSFEDCCGVYISGKKSAPTAEDLMRARYSAYAKGDIDFIKKTQDPKTRKTFDEDGAKDWASNSKWQGLELKSVKKGGPNDHDAEIEFIAKYEYKGTPSDHHELALFRKDGKEWFFVDGKVLRGQVIRETPKVGRNDVCPCGSGKKYKKCCLK